MITFAVTAGTAVPVEMEPTLYVVGKVYDSDVVAPVMSTEVTAVAPKLASVTLESPLKLTDAPAPMCVKFTVCRTPMCV